MGAQQGDNLFFRRIPITMGTIQWMNSWVYIWWLKRNGGGGWGEVRLAYAKFSQRRWRRKYWPSPGGDQGLGSITAHALSGNCISKKDYQLDEMVFAADDKYSHWHSVHSQLLKTCGAHIAHDAHVIMKLTANRDFVCSGLNPCILISSCTSTENQVKLHCAPRPWRSSLFWLWFELSFL